MTFKTTLVVRRSKLVNWSTSQSTFHPSVSSKKRILIFCSLATETEYVRGRLAAYVNDLLSLGVDGLRLDAAKRTSFLLWRSQGVGIIND